MSGSGFLLKGNDDFNARQKNTFSALSEIEKTLNRQEPMEIDQHEIIRKIPKPTTNVYSGKESIFKMPQDPVPRNFLKRIPDFKKNPHKWTKYSLEDVKDEDMSDIGNTRAALLFLKEMESRNKPVESSVDMKTNEKIIFQKPANSSSLPKEEIGNMPLFTGSKRIMPEYVIGQKIKKNKTTKNIQTEKMNTKFGNTLLKLDHLYMDDEENNC